MEMLEAIKLPPEDGMGSFSGFPDNDDISFRVDPSRGHSSYSHKVGGESGKIERNKSMTGL